MINHKNKLIKLVKLHEKKAVEDCYFECISGVNSEYQWSDKSITQLAARILSDSADAIKNVSTSLNQTKNYLDFFFENIKTNESSASPFSFQNLCRLVGLDPVSAQIHLYDEFVQSGVYERFELGHKPVNRARRDISMNPNFLEEKALDKIVKAAIKKSSQHLFYRNASGSPLITESQINRLIKRNIQRQRDEKLLYCDDLFSKNHINKQERRNKKASK